MPGRKKKGSLKLPDTTDQALLPNFESDFVDLNSITI